jgi:predicted nucleic acid-binding protein
VIVLDANVLIGFLDATDSHHAASKDLLERRFADGFGASVLTVAEALVHPTRTDRQDAALASLVAIGVHMLSVEATDAAALARVRSTYRLRMPDAVALHAALSTGSALATFDETLAAAAERAGVRIAD